MKYCVECGAALPARGPRCLLCQAPVAQAAVPIHRQTAATAPARIQRAQPLPRVSRLPEPPYSRSRRAASKGRMAWGCLPLIVGIALLLGFGLFQLIGPALEALSTPAAQSPKAAETTDVAVAVIADPVVASATIVSTVVPALAPAATRVPRATSRPTRVVDRPSPTMPPTATIQPTMISMPPTATDRPAPTLLPQVEQHVQVGDVRYTVLQIESDGQQIDSPTSSYTTEGMYVRVRVQTEDTGTEVQTAFYPTLVDSQQRLFTPFTSVAARGFVPGDERCTELITLTPNAPVVCQFIYEVPQDATGLRLRTVPYTEPAVASPTTVAPTVAASSAVPTRVAPTAVATPTTARGTRIGAVCGDGAHSKATGKSACVLHGGVNHWILAP